MASTVTVDTNEGGEPLLTVVRDRLRDLPVEVVAHIRTEASTHPALTHFASLRQLLAQGVHADFNELGRLLADLERDVHTALAQLHHQPPAPAPARITLTATQEGPSA